MSGTPSELLTELGSVVVGAWFDSDGRPWLRVDRRQVEPSHVDARINALGLSGLVNVIYDAVSRGDLVSVRDAILSGCPELRLSTEISATLGRLVVGVSGPGDQRAVETFLGPSRQHLVVFRELLLGRPDAPGS